MDGADALAVPAQFGQALTVKRGRGSEIKWKSLDKDDNIWFKAVISLFDLECESSTDDSIGAQLSRIMVESIRLNSDFLSKWAGLQVTSKCEFPLNWGLGSSSTLVFCIAGWADVDPYELYSRTFGGSGYDIACANAEGPIYYKLQNDEAVVAPARFNPTFKDTIYFIHTGKKVRTKDSISMYEQKTHAVSASDIVSISEITHAFVQAENLGEVNRLIIEHERLLSNILGLPTVKDQHFKDFWGSVKSLGAWGGDFIMVTSDRGENETKNYFSDKGLDVVLKWDDIVYSGNGN